jgi:Kae1-associated kinase Bud32
MEDLMKLIYRGAEAELWKKDYLGLPCVEKIRIGKKYRIQEIDERIRAERVQKEVNMIEQAREICTPCIYSVDIGKKSFLMEFIDGKKIKELDGKITNIAFRIGKAVAKLHGKGIIHGDLTTSNMILKNGKIYFLDFGLAYKSGKLEDRAVDLLVFKKMLKSTHFRHFEKIWANFLSGYKPKKSLLAKIGEVEKRARYVER